MAKGTVTMKGAFAEIEARKNSGGGGFFFKLPESGDSAVVRFIDKDIDWAWVHVLPKKDDQAYGKNELCRDQDPETGQRVGEACMGCTKDYPRKMQGVIRLIWRGAPVYEEVEDSNGNKKRNYDKVVGREDQVARWTVGKMVLEELDGKAATYKDLTSRDFKITRRGIKLNTSYDIEPIVDDSGASLPTPMSDHDKSLVEAASPVEFKIPDYENWGTGNTSKGAAPPPTADVGPFRKRTDSE